MGQAGARNTVVEGKWVKDSQHLPAELRDFQASLIHPVGVRGVPGIQANGRHEALDHAPDPVAGKVAWRGRRRELRFWPKISRG